MWAGGASNIGEIHMEFDQPNQDNYLINKDDKIFATFDGHGDQGHIVSSFLKAHLASTFMKTLNPEKSVKDSYRETFQILDYDICKSDKSASSGSTCVMAFLENNNLYIGGVGDCYAVLVHVNPTNGNIETKSLFMSHKIQNQEEHDRILQSGASINGEYVVSRLDPTKIINMTRAFGDQDMKTSGVISKPDIYVTKLTSPTTQNNDTKIEQDGATTEDGNKDNANTNADSNNDTTTDAPPNNNQNDTFLMLFSDGLEQVQNTEEIGKRAHKLLCDQITTDKGSSLQVDTVCSNLLKQLEEMVYERDGMGFTDDTTILIVGLSGFCTP